MGDRALPAQGSGEALPEHVRSEGRAGRSADRNQRIRLPAAGAYRFSSYRVGDNAGAVPPKRRTWIWGIGIALALGCATLLELLLMLRPWNRAAPDRKQCPRSRA